MLKQAFHDSSADVSYEIVVNESNTLNGDRVYLWHRQQVYELEWTLYGDMVYAGLQLTLYLLEVPM